jgi:long-chain fatty acid transport protein
MAGVSTATPLDAIGALYWNPAAIGRLGHDEVSIGGAFLFPDIHVSSSLPQPLLGGMTAGRTRSDSGVPLASSLGLVYAEEGSRLTYGFGLLALGGGGVNFPGDPGNPILAPTGPTASTVIGPIYSSIALYQLNPTVSYQVTDRLVIGGGLMVDIDTASLSPAFFALPTRNGGGPFVFSNATNARPFWGGGFRVGAVYSLTDTLDVGFGYSSTQWLESWKFNASAADGTPRTLVLNAQLPQIFSWGIAWRGIDRLTLGLDLRYFDYKDTNLFGTPVKSGGLGWESTFAAAVGANYQVCERLAVRAGYQYNTNPLASTSTLFNIQAPGILQNTITAGMTMNLTKSISASLGYAYSFQNSITGTVKEVPGASVGLSASNQTVLFNIQVKFGGGWAKPSACPPSCSPTSPATTTQTYESPTNPSPVSADNVPNSMPADYVPLR